MGTGKTVLFITHKLKEVMEISDYITVLKNGEVTGNVRPDEVDEAALASLMVGREVILTAQKVEKQVAAPVLEVKGLHVRDNDGNERVKGVDLAVRAGEIVGVAGVAGSGQKELVEALFGLREAQEGRVLFEGADITSKSCRERRCLGVGYVPQDRLARARTWRAASGRTPSWATTSPTASSASSCSTAGRSTPFPGRWSSSSPSRPRRWRRGCAPSRAATSRS